MNKQIVAVTLLITIVVITTAYEFNDPVFNQILADELKELHSFDYQHPRSRRDEEAVNGDKCRPPFRRKKFCCAEETFDEHHDKLKELKKECFKKVTGKDREGKPEGEGRDGRGEFDPFRCDKVDKHRKEMTCVAQCVGQKKNMLDEDGNPKEAEFTSFVKETMSKESWFASIQDKVIPTCLDEARNATSNRDTSDTESCNPAGVKLVHCLFREIQMGCPAEEIKDQKACNRVRDKIKRHNDFFPPPPPHFMHDE